MAAEPSASRSLVERLSLLPLVVAVFVGILYTVGAVLTTGQLRRANLVVRDTLPLVPLPQLLGRGMSVFLKPFAGLLAVVLVFIAVLVLGSRIEDALERRTLEWSTGRRRAARAGVIVGAVAVLARTGRGTSGRAVGTSSRSRAPTSGRSRSTPVPTPAARSSAGS